MESTELIQLKSLAPYRHLFPPSTGVDSTIKRGAGVSDTVRFMPKAAQLSKWQVKTYVDAELKHLPIYEACKKLWYFVKEHIAYEKDDPYRDEEKEIRETKEQIRSPRRLISDGRGDCDCMTNFVNACMLEYGIKGDIINRITAYDGNDHFQHIYSLIPDGKGSYVIMDCVWNAFNSEKKYSKKQDHKMELQFLDGLDSNDVYGLFKKYPTIDAMDMDRANFGMEEIGRILKQVRANKVSNSGNGGQKKGGLFRNKTPEQQQATRQRLQKVIGKSKGFSNKMNKKNPATALLRAGILASMKLNVMNVAKSLRWGYASVEHAAKRGMDVRKHPHLVKVLKKVQDIFYVAGGNPENLRLAMLKGKGNRGQEVAGLNEHMVLSELLGFLYKDELVYGMEGFEGFGSLEGVMNGGEGLGEPATGAAIAAASTLMGTIAALLKQIGVLFPNEGKSKSPARSFMKPRAKATDTNSEASAEQSSEQQNYSQSNSQASTPSYSENEERYTPPQSETISWEQSQAQNQAQNQEQANLEEENSEGTTSITNADNELTPPETENSEPTANAGNEVAKNEEANNENGTEGLSGTGTLLKTFYQKNKTWVNPTIALLGIGAIAYFTNEYLKRKSEESRTIPYKANPSPAQKNSSGNETVSGTSMATKHKRKYRINPLKKGLGAIELM